MKTLLISVLLLVPIITFAGIPDFSNCSAACAYYGFVSLFVVPDGSGQLLTEASIRDLAGDGPIDATITVTLIDLHGYPIYMFPEEDVWLESSLGGMMACAGSVHADAPSDINGEMTFTSALRAGGYSADGEQMVVLINGMPVIGNDLDIKVNSPDIDANGIVDLSDIVLFAGDMGSYNFRSDFYQDGILNLVDIVFMAGAVGGNCP
ncbi:MAG: hypothetical protein GY752_06055 [bacterium]|nr:hypothetical protein [bacterium]MCP4800901.1 hypothetical protein [bacterium]